MPCQSCNGTGKVRTFLVLQEPCYVCKGKGSVTKCRDTFKHVWSDFQSPEKEVNFRPIVRSSYRLKIKNTPLEKADVTISDLIRQGKIPPPNHIKYPFPWQEQNPFHQQYLLEKQRKQFENMEQQRKRSQFH